MIGRRRRPRCPKCGKRLHLVEGHWWCKRKRCDFDYPAQLIAPKDRKARAA